jgi:hypothetical protein
LITVSLKLKREREKKEKKKTSNSIIICTYVKKERMTKPLKLVFFQHATTPVTKSGQVKRNTDLEKM